MDRISMFGTGLLWSLEGTIVFWPVTVAIVCIVMVGAYVGFRAGWPRSKHSLLWTATPSAVTFCILLFGVLFIKEGRVYDVPEKTLLHGLTVLLCLYVPVGVYVVVEVVGLRLLAAGLCLLQSWHGLIACQIVACAISGEWP